jgi:ubiquinone/menaquinone biosynthesis C-methylase UbiE
LCDFLLNRPLVGQHRRELLAAASGIVLEIGFGTGLNLAHYPSSVAKIIAVDPNLGMHRRAKRRLQRAEVAVEQRVGIAERLPVESGTFDCAVSTFTLCSVEDIERSLSEVYRVLKPGGRFLFLEHGLSPEPSVRRWQRRLNWLEMRLGDGCRLDRDMAAVVAGHPFQSTRVEAFYLPRVPRTHGYLYRGMALK